MNRFEPSRANGEVLRCAMDTSLWTSVFEMFEGEDCTLATTQRATPLDYGAYSDLALNVPKWQIFSDEMRMEAEAHLRGRMIDNREHDGKKAGSRPRICTFSIDSYSPVQLQRLKRWFSAEEANALGLAPASEAELARLRKEISRALDYMERADPELFGEVVALVDEIIVVTPDRSRNFEFTAGSSFALWGAIVANGGQMADWTETYNMLAHEEGHILLFAMARDEPLVLNPNDAAFASPVREDRRPMDGIYHTAFVTAREARALNQILIWQEHSGSLSRNEQDLVAQSLEISVITFWQSVEVLERDAWLSDLGKSILDDCKDYMTRNFELVME